MKGLMKVCSGGNCSVGRPWKRWNDTVKECLRKRGLDVRQARRMVQDRSEWQGYVIGNAWGVGQGMTPDLDEMPQLYEPLEGGKPVCSRAYNLVHKGENFCYSSLS